jgi:spore germination protein
MPRLRFSAWLTHWNELSYASFQAHASLLSRVYPVWYVCSPAGLPLRRSDSPVALRQAVIATAKAQGVEVWPLVSNWHAAANDFDPSLMRLIMGDPQTRRMHIRRLLALVQEDGAQGIDLDYENLFDVDADAFSAFTEELCAAFHGAGLKVGMAVHAKTEEPGGPGGSRAQDYGRLGAACDSLQVMCYDFHWSTGEPGPIAPPDWGRAVMAHALKSVPAEKLEFGVPGYGNNWGPGGPAQGVGWDAWDALRQAHAPERRDPATAELTLKFNGREVWYNDSISLAAKLYQARDLGIDQAAMWVLGHEDPRWWALLDTLPDPFLRAHA